MAVRKPEGAPILRPGDGHASGPGSLRERTRERLLRPPAAIASASEPDDGGEARLARELDALVDVLQAVEVGAPAPLRALPRETICWFLDHAERFRRTVAFAALALIERVLAEGDLELRARAVAALVPFVDLWPDRVEALLLPLVEERAPSLGGPLLEATHALLLGAPYRPPLVERWLDRSPATRELMMRAQALLILRLRADAGSGTTAH